MALTDDELERANKRALARKAKYPAARSAHYDKDRSKVVVVLTNDVELAFPPSAAQGLERATPAQLKDIEISAAGTGLYFPKLDADLYVPGLLEGVMGSRKWMAARLGAEGGSARTPQKSAASRQNGKLGGRPRRKSA
jgi:hypothetical protein